MCCMKVSQGRSFQHSISTVGSICRATISNDNTSYSGSFPTARYALSLGRPKKLSIVRGEARGVDRRGRLHAEKVQASVFLRRKHIASRRNQHVSL